MLRLLCQRQRRVVVTTLRQYLGTYLQRERLRGHVVAIPQPGPMKRPPLGLFITAERVQCVAKLACLRGKPVPLTQLIELLATLPGGALRRQGVPSDHLDVEC